MYVYLRTLIVIMWYVSFHDNGTGQEKPEMIDLLLTVLEPRWKNIYMEKKPHLKQSLFDYI